MKITPCFFVVLTSLFFYSPHLKAQNLSQKELSMLGKWKLNFIDTTLQSTRPDLDCAKQNCIIYNYTQDKKYVCSQGGMPRAETGSWRMKGDTLIQFNRVLEGGIPKNQPANDYAAKIEKLTGSLMIQSGLEGNGKVYIYYAKVVE